MAGPCALFSALTQGAGLTMRVFSNRHALFPQINFKNFLKKLAISGLTGRIAGDPVDLGKRGQLPVQPYGYTAIRANRTSSNPTSGTFFSFFSHTLARAVEVNQIHILSFSNHEFDQHRRAAVQGIATDELSLRPSNRKLLPFS